MSKLSLEALKMRAGAVASEDLLMAISGGTENACHDGLTEYERRLIEEMTKAQDKTKVVLPKTN